MVEFASANIFKNNELDVKLRNGSVEISYEETDTKISFLSFPASEIDVVKDRSTVFLLKSFKTIDLTKKKILITDHQFTMILKFSDPKAKETFWSILDSGKYKQKKYSMFDGRTEAQSAETYFQFYAYLSQQQNMMNDRIRTETYQFAIQRNPNDFKGKTVLDVGTGTGLLAFFAIYAGAAKVFAIEASNMADHAKSLVTTNNLNDKITVIHSKLEDIDFLPPIDVIISEPMGYMLFNERMLETYIYGRKWLVDGGKMFPTIADFWIVPFSDETVYSEVYNKALFWFHKSFYGINLASVADKALEEYFSQPVVDTFDPKIFISVPKVNRFNFLTVTESDFKEIKFDLTFDIMYSTVLHGFAFWFSVGFLGSENTVYLSTAPDRPLTHWYQIRLLLLQPLVVQAGDVIKGTLLMVANNRQSYDIVIDVHVAGVEYTRSLGKYDLKNCYLRCYNSSTYQHSIIYEPTPNGGCFT